MGREWEVSGYANLIKVLEGSHEQPGLVSKACQVIEQCLESHKDSLNVFFTNDKCFQKLLKRVYGYDSEPSWLNVVLRPNRDVDAKALFRLMSPTGTLMAAIQTADLHKRIHYIFPVERLPSHTQDLLRTQLTIQELETWPQYKNNIKTDAGGRKFVDLNVFQYFLFWTATYVVQGGRIISGLQQVGDPSRQLRQDPRYPGLQGHPYYELLRNHLRAFLPRPGESGGPAAGTGEAMQDTSQRGLYASDAGPSQGEVLLNVLVEFWLTDNAEPAPGEVPGKDASSSSSTPSRGAGGASPLPAAMQSTQQTAPSRMFSYQPPPEELVEGIICLMRYLNVVDLKNGRVAPAQCDKPWLPLTRVQTYPHMQGRLAVPLVMLAFNCPPAFTPAYQAVARKLYRFLRRAFAQWPAATGSLTPPVRLWLTQIAPWAPPWSRPASRDGSVHGASRGLPGLAGSPAADRLQHIGERIGTQLEQALHLGHRREGGGQEGAQPGSGQYSADWRGYVLANVPFYCLLLPRFLELVYMRVGAAQRPDAALQDAIAVLSPLAAAPELLDELRKLEAAHTRYLKSHPRRAEGEYAEILPWLADQAMDWETAAVAGTPCTPPMKVDVAFRLFSTDTQGAAYAARAVLDAAAAQGAPKELLNAFQEAAARVLPFDSLQMDDGRGAASRSGPADVVGRRFPEAGKWSQLQFVKGDPIMRPITSHEFGPLVRLLVAITCRANAFLGLDRPYDQLEEPEHLLQELTQGLRRRGWRLNLRPLADLRNLTWLVVLLALLVWWVRG